MKDSNAELLCTILNESYPGQWVTQHKGIPGRMYAFDVANIGAKVAIEIEGGTHPFWTTIKGKRVKISNGRHTRPEGYEEDCNKYNAAAIEGWKVLRYTTDTLKHKHYKIMADLWQLIGKPTGKISTAQLELTMMQQQRL